MTFVSQKSNITTYTTDSSAVIATSTVIVCAIANGFNLSSQTGSGTVG